MDNLMGKQKGPDRLNDLTPIDYGLRRALTCAANCSIPAQRRSRSARSAWACARLAFRVSAAFNAPMIRAALGLRIRRLI